MLWLKMPHKTVKLDFWVLLFVTNFFSTKVHFKLMFLQWQANDFRVLECHTLVCHVEVLLNHVAFHTWDHHCSIYLRTDEHLPLIDLTADSPSKKYFCLKTVKTVYFMSKLFSSSGFTLNDKDVTKFFWWHSNQVSKFYLQGCLNNPNDQGNPNDS